MIRKKQRGETLVEVVMALGILSLVLVSSYALATGTFRIGRGAGERTQAVGYLQQQAEALRSYRDAQKWSEFTTKLAGYTGGTGGLYFCMIKQSTTNTWQPITAQGNDCRVGVYSIKIAAQSSDPHPELAPDNLSQQYRFTIEATWPDVNKIKTSSLVTTLVDQQ